MKRTLGVLFAVVSAATVSLAAPVAEAAEISPSCGRLEAAALYGSGIFREALPDMARQCGEVWGAAQGVERAWIVASSCFRYSRMSNCCLLAYPIVAALGVAWSPVGFMVGPFLPGSARARLCDDANVVPSETPEANRWEDALPGPERNE